MTTTLLKHEWLRTRGALGMFFGVTFLVGVLGGLAGATGWSGLAEFGLLVGILAVAVLVPGVQLLLAADYWRSGYGRTGYFTHSIPVRGATIFWAKVIWAVIVSLVAAVLTVPLIWVVWWAVSRNLAELPAPSLTVIGDVVAAVADVAPAWMIVAGVVLFLASIFMSVVYYFFSVSIGHEHRLASLGVGGPIVVFVVVYVVSQIASFLGMVVIPFGVGMDGDGLGLVPFNVLAEMAEGTTGGGDVMPVGFLFALLVIAVFCLWRTARSWNREVALR